MLEPENVSLVDAQTYTTHWTNKVETDDVDDGDGISHTSKVRYNQIIWPSPIRFKVTRVRYEARKPDQGFFWYSGQWKREYTKYYDRDSSNESWTLVTSNSGTLWSNAEEDLTQFDNDAEAMLHTNGMVTQRLRYKEKNWLFNTWWEIPGRTHVHHPN